MEEIADGDAVTPEVLDRHWPSTTTDTEGDDAGESREPEADDADEPDPDAEDTSDDDAEPEDEDADTSEDDDAGDDEDPDEGDEEDDEEEDDDFLRVSKEERERIESDPALKKLHRSMQKHFTQATQAAASARREAETIKGELDEFLTTLASDDGAEEFLLEIAVQRPELFEKVYERASELTDDPDEKKRYERERDLARREKDQERRDQAAQAAAINERAEAVIGTMTRMAKSAKLSDPADLDLLERAIATRIAENHHANGKRDITDAEIQAEVSAIAKAARAKEARIRGDAAKERTGKDIKAAKQKASAARRTPPPRSTSAPGGKVRKPAAVPEGVDPVAHRISELLGTRVT